MLCADGIVMISPGAGTGYYWKSRVGKHWDKEYSCAEVAGRMPASPILYTHGP